MKLTFPTRFPPAYIFGFAGAVAAAAMVEGTQLTVALLTGTFIAIAGMAFNVAGGLSYPSGSYIFFLALLTLVVGAVAKILVGEPLDHNLRDPQQSLLVYNAGMLAAYAAAWANRDLRRKQPFLRNVLTNVRVEQVAMGCVIIGIWGPIAIPYEYLSTFNQFNYFLVFAVLLPVYTQAQETDGKSTFNWISFGAWLYWLVVLGLLAFSKLGIFAGSLAWIVAAGAAGYRISKVRLAVLTAIMVAASVILTPFAQVGRIYRGDPQVFDHAVDLLSHPQETRELYNAISESAQASSGAGVHWFDHPQGIVDRLTMFPIDDALIYVTDHGHPQTLAVIWSDLVNVVPRYLYPDKPNPHWGNAFGHEIGLLTANDFSTGISFSPFSDAYHDGQWFGITLMAAFFFFCLFWVTDSVTGPANQSVWALLYILYFSHSAPEGGMGGAISGATTLSFGVFAAAYAITRIAPLVGQFVTPPKRASPKGAAARAQGAAART